MVAGEASTYKPPALLQYFEALKNQEVKYNKFAETKLVIPPSRRTSYFDKDGTSMQDPSWEISWNICSLAASAIR
jgi:antitoxin component of MazEF toxin-antitoxin module